MKYIRKFKIVPTLSLMIGLVLGSFVPYSYTAQAVEQGSGLVLAGSPAAPSDLTATSAYPRMDIELKWSPVVGANYYVVYRSETNSFSGPIVPIGKTTIATTTYIDSVLTTNTYYYKVAGYNDRGEGYNSAVANTSTCIVPLPSGDGGTTRGGIAKAIPRDPPPLPPQSPLPNSVFCPGFRVGGTVGAEVEVQKEYKYWVPADNLSKIIFKNVPKSDQVYIEPGKNLKFDYTWTNKLDKNKVQNPNRKFTIRRRLWDWQGNKVMEKSYPYIIYPGKSKSIMVNETFKQDLAKGEYTMEVEVVHYIPYSDEAEIVADKNSFKFLVQ